MRAGTGLESIGKAAREIKQSRDRFNLASALSRFETGVNDLAIRYDQDAGFADLPQRYRADVKALHDEVAGTLDPELRDQFHVRQPAHGRSHESRRVAPRQQPGGLEGNKKLDTDLAQLLLARGSAFDSDPAGMIRRADELIGVAQNAGYGRSAPWCAGARRHPPGETLGDHPERGIEPDCAACARAP